MVIGLLLGGLHGEAAIPPRWAAAHVAHARAKELLASLDARDGSISEL
jgi:hypothetical protein